MSALQAVKAERLDKYISAFNADENSKGAISRFLNEPECLHCFCYASAESVTANTDFPTAAQMKKKVIVLHRVRKECDITKDNIHQSVIILELNKNVMDLLNVYCHSVYLSTLMNPANQRGWSDLISKDLMDKYHVFLANLHVTVGLMRGHTLLPQPPRDALPASGASLGGTPSQAMGSKDRVHVLEGAVIT
jgi:dynein heavy chain